MYDSPPLSTRDTFQDSKGMPETMGSTKPVYTVFFPYIYITFHLREALYSVS